MKRKLNILAVIMCMCGLAEYLSAQGYIVANGVTYGGTSPTIGTQIEVIQNPTNGDSTGFSLPPRGMTQPTLYVNTFGFNVIVDEGVRVFLVLSNNPITLDAILANSYPELTGSNRVFENGEPFYLGLYTGYNPWDSHGNYTGIYTNPLFGWGKFVNDQGVIHLLDSALEIGGGGINAGTQDILAVPEPSTILLGGLGLVFLIAVKVLRLKRRT